MGVSNARTLQLSVPLPYMGTGLKSDTPSIFSKKYPKIIKNAIFLLNFDQNFLKFSHQCFFRPNARKISAWFVNFFEKHAKIIHFSQISYEIF